MARVSLNSPAALGLRHRLSPVSVKADRKPSMTFIGTLFFIKTMTQCKSPSIRQWVSKKMPRS